MAFEKFIKQNTNVSSILMHSSFTYEREIDALLSWSKQVSHKIIKRKTIGTSQVTDLKKLFLSGPEQVKDL